ncbi:MAG: hypothetical protein DMG07_01970 [Acidobacteria bacterium]|nr:MAG: hypothetical protein DMG07_01970 [Acidobacteriota bacterium]
MRLAEVPTTERDRVFRYSRARALALVCALIVIGSGAVRLGLQRRAWLPFYVAGMLILVLVVAQRLILARFRTTNWLARAGDTGLFIQFRSYLNYGFPAEAPTVVFIPYEEIRRARRVRKRRRVPAMGDRDESSEQVRTVVELELAGDTAPLAQALAAELATPAPKEARWYGSTSTRYKHHPVRLKSPACLEVEWGVVPNARAFLDGLRRYTEIEPPVETSQDYVHLQTKSRDEQEKRLVELAEAGQVMAAITIARQLYGYDLKAARDFVEDLRGGKGRPVDPVIPPASSN